MKILKQEILIPIFKKIENAIENIDYENQIIILTAVLNTRIMLKKEKRNDYNNKQKRTKQKVYANAITSK